jgi:hypothetical protein
VTIGGEIETGLECLMKQNMADSAPTNKQTIMSIKLAFILDIGFGIPPSANIIESNFAQDDKEMTRHH